MWSRITKLTFILLLAAVLPLAAQSERGAEEAVVVDLAKAASFWPTATDLASQPGALSADADLEAVLVARAIASRQVGERRLRDLQTAHFHLQRRDLAPAPFDADHDEKESERILLSCVGKLTRKHLEERSGFADWLERLEERRSTNDDDGMAEVEKGWGWRVSPRFRLGSRDTVGVRFRPRHPDRPWVSRFHVGLRHDLDDGTTALRAGYTTGSHSVRLELHPDGEEHGDRWALSGAWRF